jgi:hypothetical protein
MSTLSKVDITTESASSILQSLREDYKELLKRIERIQDSLTYLERKLNDKILHDSNGKIHLKVKNYFQEGDRTMSKSKGGQNLKIKGNNNKTQAGLSKGSNVGIGENSAIAAGDNAKVQNVKIGRSLKDEKEVAQAENLLKDLEKGIEDLLKEKQGLGKVLKKRLEEVQEEAASETPDKESFKFSLKGLLSAAKEVSEVVSGPVVSTVLEIAKLFGVPDVS